MAELYTNEQFDKKVDFIEDWVVDMCKREPTEEVFPMAFIVGKDPNSDSPLVEYPVMLPDMPSDPGEKRKLIGRLGEALVHQAPTVEPVAIILMSEVWSKRLNKEETDMDNLPRPSECADRVEGIAISGVAYDGRVNMTLLPTIRNADNTIRPDTENATRTRAEERGDVQNNITSEFFAAHAIAKAFGQGRD